MPVQFTSQEDFFVQMALVELLKSKQALYEIVKKCGCSGNIGLCLENDMDFIHSAINKLNS